MISRRALGVAGTRGRLAWRLDIVRPTEFSAQSPLDAILEKLEVIEEHISSKMDSADGASSKRGLGDYLLRRLDSLDRDVKALKIDNAKLNEQMQMQTSYHMEWCQRDLCVLAAEILKWCIGARGATGGDGRQFYATTNQRDVEIGTQVFHRGVEDIKDFSRLVILARNHEVHFGSFKLLDDRVETAQRYIQDFGSYLRVSRPKEVEVIDNYAVLKKALPDRFC